MRARGLLGRQVSRSGGQTAEHIGSTKRCHSRTIWSACKSSRDYRVRKRSGTTNRNPILDTHKYRSVIDPGYALLINGWSADHVTVRSEPTVSSAQLVRAVSTVLRASPLLVLFATCCGLALQRAVQPPPAVTGLILSPRVKRRPCHSAPPADLHSVRATVMVFVNPQPPSCDPWHPSCLFDCRCK